MPNALDTACHMVRYGISADQKYLAGEFLGTYHCVAMNGNMVAHIPAALAEFTVKAAGVKPFVVDPQTHAFQHDPRHVRNTNDDGGEVVKSSVRKMAEAFGEPALGAAGTRAILPTDFANEEVVGSFCQGVIEFQLDTIDKQAQSKDFMKYLRFIGIDAIAPECVIAPYFWMDVDTVDDWLRLNLDFVDAAPTFARGKPVYAQLVIGQDVLLGENTRSQLAEAYGTRSCEGVFLWVDQFSEHQVSRAHLGAYSDFARRLSAEFGKRVVTMYAGYWSMLLCRLVGFGWLAGICHGLEYGEDRAVVPVGGGLPMSKFYLPAYHKRLRFGDAVRAIREMGGFRSPEAYYETVCACPVCREVITTDPSEQFARFGVTRPVQARRGAQVVTLNYPVPETKDLCLRHYLHNKQREFDETPKLVPTDVASQLDLRFGEAQRLFGMAEAAYLRNWAALLRDLQ